MVPDNSPPLVKGSARWRRGRELLEGAWGRVLHDGEHHRVWATAAIDMQLYLVTQCEHLIATPKAETGSKKMKRFKWKLDLFVQ